MTTDTRGDATAPARTPRALPGYWHAELIPFDLCAGAPQSRQICFPRRGPAAWSRRPLPLLWEPDGIAAHTEPIQVGTVEAFAVGIAEELYDPSHLIRILSAAGRLDVTAPGFAALLDAAHRLAPYGHGHRLAGDRTSGFLLGVRADLVDITTDEHTANRPAVDYEVASVTVTTAPPYREGCYLRLDKAPHLFT